MGWDMNCVVEALNRKTEKWDFFAASMSHRNTEMFFRIAGFGSYEGEIEPIDDCRGSPVDTSDPTDTWSDYNEDWSSTWLDRTELESLNQWLKERYNLGAGFKNCLWQALDLKYLSALFNLEGDWAEASATRYKDLRVLFYFSH